MNNYSDVQKAVTDNALLPVSKNRMPLGKGVFRCRRPHFLVQKNFGYFEIYGISAQTRDMLSQCGHFADRGSILRDFVWTSFTDGSLHYSI